MRALIMNRTIRISRSFVPSFVPTFLRLASAFQGSKRDSWGSNKKMSHGNRGGFIRKNCQLSKNFATQFSAETFIDLLTLTWSKIYFTLG